MIIEGSIPRYEPEMQAQRSRDGPETEYARLGTLFHQHGMEGVTLASQGVKLGSVGLVGDRGNGSRDGGSSCDDGGACAVPHPQPRSPSWRGTPGIRQVVIPDDPWQLPRLPQNDLGANSELDDRGLPCWGRRSQAPEGWPSYEAPACRGSVVGSWVATPKRPRCPHRRTPSHLAAATREHSSEAHEMRIHQPSGSLAMNGERKARWGEDIAASIVHYNEWFLSIAPTIYEEAQTTAIDRVREMLKVTSNLTRLDPDVLRNNPRILPSLRMSTRPPLAVDRLISLSGADDNLVRRMERGKLPNNLGPAQLDADLDRIVGIVLRMADPNVFAWLPNGDNAKRSEIRRAVAIVAERLAGSVANPQIRGGQEQRQVKAVRAWLEARGYSAMPKGTPYDAVLPGSFRFGVRVPGKLDNGDHKTVPVDLVVKSAVAKSDSFPLLIEAKSAGDCTNVNKRRKEEADKARNLRNQHGGETRFVMLLGGHFDVGYLGYARGNDIDWVWEHRLDDLTELGL